MPKTVTGSQNSPLVERPGGAALFAQNAEYVVSEKKWESSIVSVSMPKQPTLPAVITFVHTNWIGGPRDIEGFSPSANLPGEFIALLNRMTGTENRFRSARYVYEVKHGYRALSEEGLFERVKDDPRLKSFQWEKQGIPPDVVAIRQELASPDTRKALSDAVRLLSRAVTFETGAKQLGELAKTSQAAAALLRVGALTARGDRAETFLRCCPLDTAYGLACLVKPIKHAVTSDVIATKYRKESQTARGMHVADPGSPKDIAEWNRTYGKYQMTFPEHQPGSWYLVAAGQDSDSSARFRTQHSDGLVDGILKAGGRALVIAGCETLLHLAVERSRIRTKMADCGHTNAAERIEVVPVLDHHKEVWNRDDMGIPVLHRDSKKLALIGLPYVPAKKVEYADYRNMLWRSHLSNFGKIDLIPMPFWNQGGNIVPLCESSLAICDAVLKKNPHVTKADLEMVYGLLGYSEIVWVPPTDEDTQHSDTAVFGKDNKVLVPEFTTQSLRIFSRHASTPNVEKMIAVAKSFHATAEAFPNHFEVRRIPIPLVDADPSIYGRLSPANAQVVTADNGEQSVVIAWPDANTASAMLDAKHHGTYKRTIREAYEWCGFKEVHFVSMDPQSGGGARCAVNALPDQIVKELLERSLFSWR